MAGGRGVCFGRIRDKIGRIFGKLDSVFLDFIMDMLVKVLLFVLVWGYAKILCYYSS